jgi:hypothetical protein
MNSVGRTGHQNSPKCHVFLSYSYARTQTATVQTYDVGLKSIFTSPFDGENWLTMFSAHAICGKVNCKVNLCLLNPP